MRQNLFFNSVIVVLLLVCAIGIFTVPRFNYGVLVKRMTDLEMKVEALRAKCEALDKLKVFSDDNATKKAALLDSIFSLPAVLERVQKSVADVSEEVGSFHFLIDGVLTRLETLERESAEVAEVPEPEDVFSRYRKSYIEPLKLPEEIRNKADFFSSQGIAEGDFNSFLQDAIRSKCLTYDDTGKIPIEEYEHLVKAFSVFKGNMELINREGHMKVTEAAAVSDQKGSFMEMHLHADRESQLGLPAMAEPGIVYRKTLREQGVSRTYYLPYSVYPELARYEAMRENARDHLVRDVIAIHQSSRNHPAIGEGDAK